MNWFASPRRRIAFGVGTAAALALIVIAVLNWPTPSPPQEAPPNQGWGFESDQADEEVREEERGTPVRPRLELTRATSAEGLSVSVDLSTRCFGLTRVPYACASQYGPAPYGEGASIELRDGLLFDAVREPPQRFHEPVLFIGFHSPVFGSYSPWYFHYPLLDIALAGEPATRAHRVDIVVRRSTPDARPFVQVFHEGVANGMISIFNQGSSPVSGGEIEYDIIPVSPNSVRYVADPAAGDARTEFDTDRCPPSAHRELTRDEIDTFLTAESASGRSSRTYRFREQIPGFSEQILFAPLRNMTEAAPELAPISSQLAGIWVEAIGNDGEFDDGVSVIDRDFLISNANRSTLAPLTAMNELARRCLPTEFLVDARLTLHSDRGGQRFSKTTMFRGLLHFTFPGVGAPPSILDFSDAATFQVEGENYRITRLINGESALAMMLFARESSTHEFHIEILASDDRVLWRSAPMRSHLIVPGHEMRVLLEEEDIPAYSRMSP